MDVQDEDLPIRLPYEMFPIGTFHCTFEQQFILNF